MVNDPVKVCNIFNDYLINAASDIGKEHPIQHDENNDNIRCSYKDQSIVWRIKSHVSRTSTLNFSPANVKEVHDLMKNGDQKRPLGMKMYHQNLQKWQQTSLPHALQIL